MWIEELLQHQCDELSPKSLNELRGSLHRIFKRAIQRALWHGPNPAATVEKRKVPRKLFDTLRADEVPRLLAALSRTWRPLFATAIWTGMRKGELLGLQKSDIDFVSRSIAVRRSYDHETTKGGGAGADLLHGFVHHFAVARALRDREQVRAEEEIAKAPRSGGWRRLRTLLRDQRRYPPKR